YSTSASAFSEPISTLLKFTRDLLRLSRDKGSLRPVSGHDSAPVFTTRPTIMARRGVVTSGHYLASLVGLEVLARGGNAIDAGVATAFALTLVKPHECGIGGECPILIYQPAGARGGRGARDARPDRPNPYVISGQ